ncbi:acetylglutamate kinase [Actinomycetaceae bacterium WB03_NA08]|uniref:Acetylglutamate kinase n=1 Tax=Scrofimicrobium canadense TaxID=2652290 RepID=A0A6N7W6T9_9ACTO|nr:acetylglutamate kinase [Scrofimicrobium canadense]MSS83878.1 acetylglutamate kinase [Scrofimicrobium canadense]
MSKIAFRDKDLSQASIFASTLISSLPWLEKHRGKVIVIKFGGNAMINPELQAAFADDIAYLRHVGIQPVVVHGGGPQITEMLDRLGIQSEFRGGYRVTNREAIEVVRMVLQGMVNPQIVSLINKHGPLAVGFSGEDAAIFKAHKMQATIDGDSVDLGFVGEVVEVDPRPVLEQLKAGRIPVISTIAPDIDDPGETLNVNADLAAGALAAALKASRALLLTDVEGLYADWPRRDSLISQIAVSELRERLPSLESGMIPKMQACLDAVEGGVPRATVIDGRVPHSVLVELFTDDGIGTEVRGDDE